MNDKPLEITVRLLGVAAALLLPVATLAQPAAPTVVAADPVRTLTGRLDLTRYKATI